MKTAAVVVTLLCIVAAVFADISTQQSAWILAAHNQARTQVSPIASPALSPLAWSSTLAASAQKWASQCILDQSDEYWWKLVGENVAGLAGATLATANLTDAVATWAKQSSNYLYDVPECADDMECDNYIQLVSSVVTAVGCGVAQCDGGAFFVCQYDVYATWNGVVPYTAGPHMINDPYAEDDISNMTTRSTRSMEELHVSRAGAFNWKSSRRVTSVKNQGQCGCCWAFASAAQAEGAWAKKTGKLVNLSPQELIDCSRKGNNGCNGGWHEWAFQWINTNGLMALSKYSFKGKQSSCKKSGSPVASFGSYSGGVNGVTNIVATCKAQGPLAVLINSQCMGKSHGKGVRAGGGSPDHEVLLVGWDGKNYIIKNSWGTKWGRAGYAKISGTKSCGIQGAAYLTN